MTNEEYQQFLSDMDIKVLKHPVSDMYQAFHTSIVVSEPCANDPSEAIVDCINRIAKVHSTHAGYSNKLRASALEDIGSLSNDKMPPPQRPPMIACPKCGGAVIMSKYGQCRTTGCDGDVEFGDEHHADLLRRNGWTCEPPKENSK